MDKSNLKTKINEAVSYIKSIKSFEPEIGIILGTGLDILINDCKIIASIPYADIPHFPLSTVESHSGNLIFAELSGKKVVLMQGRMHFYEGYSFQDIVFPVRVMKFLGIEKLIITNACGTMNPMFRKGRIMIIDDHINLLPGNPLIGPNDDSIGVRFPDMSQPYSQELIAKCEEIARSQQIIVHKGVYVAMPGPMLETRAEYRFLRAIGADVVGMSTVPETIAAVHMGLPVLGLSIMTDECYPDALKPCNIKEIIDTANKAVPDLANIIEKLLMQL